MGHHQDSRAGVVRDVVPFLDEGLTALRNPHASWIGRVRSAVVANDVCNDLRVAGLLDLDSGGPVPDYRATDQLVAACVEGDDAKAPVVLDGVANDVGRRAVGQDDTRPRVVLDRTVVSLQPAG